MLKPLFMLNPNVAFLNHGSFGACPRPVFEVYQEWQRRLEYQPVEFLGRRIDSLLDEARRELAAYLRVDADDVFFVQNATTGVNIAARSLKLQPGDEILTTDHEYGACDNTWEFVCAKTGAVYIKRGVPLPLTTPEAFIEYFWAWVTPKTRVIFMSHITSPSALIFPVEEICRRARAAGILTLIDGAHAPGHVPLDLTALDADYYTGNLHKWLCAPKGSGFLYVRRERQLEIEPLIISWGWHDDGSFVAKNQKQGTRDPAAYLSVPAAIKFQRDHEWDAVRERCRLMVIEARQRLAILLHQPMIAPESWLGQMFTMPIPPCDAEAVKIRLYDDYGVEVPVVRWKNGEGLRVSIQGYNTRDDLERLYRALAEIFNR